MSDTARDLNVLREQRESDRRSLYRISVRYYRRKDSDSPSQYYSRSTLRLMTQGERIEYEEGLMHQQYSAWGVDSYVISPEPVAEGGWPGDRAYEIERLRLTYD